MGPPCACLQLNRLTHLSFFRHCVVPLKHLKCLDVQSSRVYRSEQMELVIRVQSKISIHCHMRILLHDVTNYTIFTIEIEKVTISHAIIENIRRRAKSRLLVLPPSLIVFLSDPSPNIGYPWKLALTQWLTYSCIVDLTVVALVCEDANSKLVEVVADVDDEDCVDIILILNYLDLRFGP